jgi:tetratricopeptide (TPR) repeat protein
VDNRPEEPSNLLVNSNGKDIYDTSPNRSWPATITILLLVTCLLAPTVAYQFLTWDDIALIETNPLVINASLKSLRTVWTEPYIEIYMPITYSLWILLGWPAMLVGHLRGLEDQALSPQVYHVVTMLIFIGVVYRVFELIRRFTPDPWIAAAASLLYACHPMQAESACWLSENKGILGALFGLWAMAIYVDAVRTEDRSIASRLHWKATILYTLALLSKPSMVNLPLMAAVIDFGLVRRPPAKVLLGMWRWVALAAIMVFITRQSQPSAAKAAVPWIERPFVAIDALTFYLYQTFVPLAFRPDYSRTPQSVLAGVTHPELVGILAWGGIAVVLGILLFIRQRALAAIIALYIAILSPNLGFLPFAFQMMSTTADRYGSPALLAVSLGAALLMSRVQSKYWGLGICAVLVTLLTLKAIPQIGYWRNMETLTAHQLRFQPTSPIFLNNRAADRMRRGVVEPALSDAKESTNLKPENHASWMNVLICLIRLERFDEAAELGKQMVERFPENDNSLETLTKMLQYRRQFAEAAVYAKRLHEMRPANRDDKLRYARLLILSGKSAEGLAIFAADRGKENFVGLEAEEVEAQVFEQAGQHKEALDRYRVLVNRYGQRAKLSQSRMAWIQATSFDETLRQPSRAFELARRTLDSYASTSVAVPAYAYDVLAAAEANMGDFEQARKHISDAMVAAKRESNSKLLAETINRKKLYDEGKPFRSTPPALTGVPTYAVR